MTRSDPELQLPVPFPLDDRAGPAPRVARERAAEMINAALLEYDQAPRTAAARVRTKLWTGRMATWAAAAAALLVLVGGAAAARYYFHFGETAPAPTRSQRTHAPVRTTVVAPIAPVTPAAAAAAAEPEPAPAAVSGETEPESMAAAPSVVSRPARGSAVSGTPEDRLQKANQLRAAGHFREAAAMYSQVYERFPRTFSAYVARVAGGAIELEHLANPTRARKLFEQALREQPRGALDLEARQGLCLALRDLEDRTAEVRALHGLVAAHPNSPAARRAQVRLRELGDPDE